MAFGGGDEISGKQVFADRPACETRAVEMSIAAAPDRVIFQCVDARTWQQIQDEFGVEF
ncbi:hypothetical protein [Mesorhizobium sp. B2-8-9]|uniref:hypothetical protein n=1 Tax=Mesorhizobium sp. B2-8-9 TaxID=2589899 RepID=UPI0015E2B71C|nr:hypothetical protein [Mesorhizobium sp. B2-8-9]